MAIIIDQRSIRYVGPEPRRQRALCAVSIAGTDVTDKFDPYLMSVTIEDPENGMSSASIELDDRYGRIVQPEGSQPIDILLGWPDEGNFKSFSGTVSDTESYGQKRSGRMMKIEATGLDIFQSGKSMLRMQFGDGDKQQTTIGDALSKAAQAAGFQVNVDPSIAQLQRPYMAAHNESFPAFAQRVASETGGTLQIQGTQATITGANSFVPALGAGGAIMCAMGQNVISWRIKPVAAAPAWGTVGHMHFDPDQAKWLRSSTQASGGGDSFSQARADFTGVMPHGHELNATQAAAGSASASDRQRGYGWIVINGEPRAVKQGGCTVQGIRSGVDGDYRIVGVTSMYSRQGFTTRLSINQPGSNFGSVAGFTAQ